ncbi:MAG: cupin domain-containing protein [Oscillospiraceae bacterium]|nr:cupin domain-containing protein [Oscillospiraceae bacterium]
MNDFEKAGLFGIGNPNEAYAKYFVGESYLNPVTTTGVGIFNVTFEPKCRNNWHIHHADQGGGQILLCMSGRGWYQEFGKAPIELHQGDSIVISAGVKHWHGAAKDSWFAHLAVEVPGENTHTEWCEAVSDNEYDKLD